MRALLLAALLLAGCAAPPPAAPPDAEAPAPSPPSEPVPASAPPPAPAPPREPFEPAVAALAGCGACFEPSVAVDGAGRILAAAAREGPLASLRPGAEGAEVVPAPALPPGAPQPASRSDVLLQSAPDGRIYYSALVARDTGLARVLEGLHVAWTEDGGATWGANVYLAAPQGALAPDRQWLGFGPGGLVYLAYNQVPTGIWVARSDDGGATWAPFVPAAPSALRGGAVGQAGPPVVDATGRVHMPATTSDGGIVVFSSDDGRVWTPARAIAGEGLFPAWFPVAAVDEAGGLHVAAWYASPAQALAGLGSDDARVLVASSADRGATWGAPVAWGEGVATSPWLLAHEGRLVLVWYRAEGDGLALVVSRGDAAGPAEEVVAARGVKAGARGANTDFAHAALLADGRALVAWSLPDDAVYVARERSA